MKFLKQIQSTVGTGTSPLSVSSTTLNTNLNADLLDGNHASAFYLATNPNGYTTNTGTVTSVTAGSYLTGGTITGSGTLAVDATTSSTALKIVARDSSGGFSAGPITLDRANSANEGGQINFAKSLDNTIGWYIDVYGNTSTPSLRFVSNNGSIETVRLSIDGNTGELSTAGTVSMNIGKATNAFVVPVGTNKYAT